MRDRWTKGARSRKSKNPNPRNAKLNGYARKRDRSKRNKENRKDK
ncbi:hypothetical protein COLO4_27910 [Corchorus olitorius]|uniref:Uncharacterized protein n=1 Tax=Corchorus olitorius TaxID=93759 RepID=A0A1R3HNZ1_9ROSI|nr:hypothetical protein COLO4_27910 [Corchorus olitorius]